MQATTRSYPRNLIAVSGASIALALITIGASLVLAPVHRAIGVSLGPLDPRVNGVVLWTGITLAASALAVSEPGRATHTLADTTLVAVAALGGPTAAGLVALVGTTERRELRTGAPWWGLLASHAQVAFAWTAGAAVMHLIEPSPVDVPTPLSFTAVAAGAVVALVLNFTLTGLQVAARTARRVRNVLVLSPASTVTLLAADSVTAWLVAIVYTAGAWWSASLIIVIDIATAQALVRHGAVSQLGRNPLTDLPNRRGLADRVRQLRRADVQGAAVLYVDLDGFKAVNDRHGHEAGDEVLRVTGRRLAEVCRDRDFIAHLHGDEFVVIASGVGDEEGAGRLAERLVRAVEPPIPLDGVTVRVTATVGIRVATDLAALDAAIRDADQSMNEAKAAKASVAGTPRRLC